MSPFGIETYLLYNRDIVEAKVNPLTHFFIFGSKEDRFCFEEKYSDRYAASYILEYLFQIINMYGKVAIIDNCSFVYSQQLLSFDKEFEMIQKLNITNCQNWSNLLFQQFNAQSFLSNKIFSGIWFKPTIMIVKNGEIVDYRMESMDEASLVSFFTKNGL